MTTSRIQSVDYIRGLVMVLMAVDHVRVYSGVPSFSTEPDVFLTRWITHFCAPAFAFFAGTSAFLYGAKTSKSELIKFLITRGLILIVLELTVIRFLWAFNISADFILAGVIWMLGCCMLLLTLFVRLKPAIAGIVGVGIILLQHYFAYVPGFLPEPWQKSFGTVWEFIYPAGFETFKGVTILYVLVPWIGVMIAGYGFGEIILMRPERKRKYCLIIGIAAIAVYLAVGVTDIVLFAQPNETPFVIKLLGQNKYPASVLFLLMTLGPTILLVPYADMAKGWLRDAFVTIGKVPFFYYLLHIPVIHISALVVNYFRMGRFTHDLYYTAPYTWFENKDYVWSLPLLYLIFFIDVVLLYFACRWYGAFKSRHPENQLLKYI